MNRSGSLLVVTLWIITILSALAVSIASFLSLEVRLTKYYLAREQAKVLARSGVYLAIARLNKDAEGEEDDKKDKYDWLGDDWAVFPDGDPKDPTAWVINVPIKSDEAQLQGDEIRIYITDEELKLNINAASKEQLTRLFGSFDIDNASDLAQGIVDYRDTDNAGEIPGTDPPYYQKNAPVVTLEELSAMPLVNSVVLGQLAQFTSASPKGGLSSDLKVNINTASPRVLSAIGLASLADEINGFREQGHYFKQLQPTIEVDDPTSPAPFDSSNTEFVNAASILTVSSQTFTIQAKGIIKSPSVQYWIKALVQRAASEGGKATILLWSEG